MPHRDARVRYTPPWKVSDAGCSFWPLHHLFNRIRGEKFGPLKPVDVGTDEWGNEALIIVVPLLGAVDIFTGRNVHGGRFDRSKWFFVGTRGHTSIWVSPDYRHEAELPHPDELAADFAVDTTDADFPLPAPASEEMIRAHARKVEPVDLT